MQTRPSLGMILCSLTIFLLLGACGEAEDQPVPEQEALKSDSVSSEKKPLAATTKPSKPAGLCALMTPGDVAAALGGKLPLAPPKVTRTGCTYAVQFGIDGNAVTYRKTPRGNYDNLRHYENEGGVEFEFIANLGQEAFLVNGAQVCVLLNDDEALFVSAQLVSFGEESPISKEELKAGLIEIATVVEDQL